MAPSPTSRPETAKPSKRAVKRSGSRASSSKPSTDTSSAPTSSTTDTPQVDSSPTSPAGSPQSIEEGTAPTPLSGSLPKKLEFSTEVIERNKRNLEKAEKEREARSKANKQKKALYLWSQASVPKLHEKKYLAELRRNADWEECWYRSTSCAQSGGVVILCGTRGNGKTQCAVELIRANCKQSKKSRYCRASQIGMEIRAAYDGRPISVGGDLAVRTEQDIIYGLASFDLLVIDECQSVPQTDFMLRIIELVVDLRYGDMKPTILIANTSVDNLAGVVGESVLDRCNELGGVLVFDWSSFRHA